MFDKTAISDNKRLTTTTGQEEGANNYCVSDYIYVRANFTYYIANPQSSRCWFYDVNKNPTIYDFLGTSRTFTPTTDGYIRVTIYKALVNVDTFQINIGSAAVPYEPYSSHEYALPNIDLRGLYKLDANNNLYADGDTLEGDGTLTRNWLYIDLGTYNWTYVSASNAFFTIISEIERPTVWYERYEDMICDKYPCATVPALANIADKTMIKFEDGKLYIKDTSYTDAQTFKASLNGVYLVAKRETPTTETATGFTNPQVVDKYGTEEYTDERDFPLPVGHETDYPLDSEMALPVPPVTAGTYNLQLTVDASGNQTYSWAT